MAKVLVDGSYYRVLGGLFQQLRFCSPQTLLEQSYRAERLVRVINPSNRYPYDFICFKLTDYRPREPVSLEPMSGGDLLADLARFIWDVSSQSAVSVDHLPERAVAASHLAERAGVSEKTLRRWQRYGLALRRVTTDAGRTCEVILAGTWEWFVDHHERRVSRAAAFSRVSTTQRRWVVREARKLFHGQGLKRHQIEKMLADRIGRARETVRYILNRHDASARADRRVFPARSKLSQDDGLRIWEMYRRGVPASHLARACGRSVSSVYRIIHNSRTSYWLGREVDYVYSAEFDMPNAAETILARSLGSLEPAPVGNEHMPVLTSQRERVLFRAYNYLKFRQSEAVRPYRGGKVVPSHILKGLDDLELQAQSVRDRLVVANQALVISIAKRHVQYGLTLAELSSEGTGPLLKSIEKFDYTRGFKFSTYASWAIMKHFARTVPEHGNRQKRYRSYTQDEFELLVGGESEVDEAGLYRRSRAVQEALDHLDDRERRILTNRFSLDRTSQPMSLAQLGNILGVSKERVRQLELRAKEKMHAMLKESISTDVH